MPAISADRGMPRTTAGSRCWPEGIGTSRNGQKQVSAQPGATFELLTPLAEGADRIAAHEALAAGITLVVPMPMAQAEYERDFTTEESLAELQTVLKDVKEPDRTKRARLQLVQALINHNDFVTVR